MDNRSQKFCSILLLFFQRFDHGAALKIECKMSHLLGTVMHYILVKAYRSAKVVVVLQ